ncbi:HAD family hydrolase [Spiribacter halobius]|uniref:HAD family hydrolase n=1 Tax=Sediminicurvatus halobius TaxID=2182432 RepID=A0A2U2N3D7_9GAMM|nr:HAD hydrolase-like protein [Spiribacter halobius]PWG63735.1 hypothetical protein DEM34_07605 [Spiribacter halobius]UEX76214.1 HAD hydrolase-like protein [Spiribacter halobius]
MTESRPWRLLMDVEGVVFDPLPAVVAALRRALLRVGRPAPLGQDLDWVASVPLGTTLATLVGHDGQCRAAFLGHLQHYYRSQSWRGLPAYPGIAEALRRLRHEAEAEIVLVSAHDMDTAWRQAVDQGLDDVFDSVVCPERGCCPECRQKLVIQLIRESSESHRVAWLTDMPAELVQARRRGVMGIAAAWGRAPLRAIRGGEPTVLAERPEQLPDALTLPQAWLDSLMAPWSPSKRAPAPVSPPR